MRRCCAPIPNEFAPSYASVLASQDLPKDIKELEAGQLQPCLTAWCPTCQAPYLITAALPLFKSPSAHHAHMLALARNNACNDLHQATTSTSDAAPAAAPKATR
jgi:hypothetical protein